MTELLPEPLRLVFQQAALSGPLVAGLLGLVLGSYLNVVALRWLPGAQFHGRKRSLCPHCQRLLRWYELIPLVSYLVQLGRCRRCGARLSWRYPAVELVTAFVCGLIAWQYPTSEGLVLLALALVLVLLALIDLDHGLLPDRLTLSSVGGVVFYLMATKQNSLISDFGFRISDFESWFWGALVGAGTLGVIVLLTRGRGMGIGDIKLAGLLGLALGGSATLLALLVAFTVGALVGLLLIVTGRATWKSAVPFGPLLVFGWFVAVIGHGPILAWYTGLS